MNRLLLTKLLIAAILFQLLVLIGMQIKASYPLWAGQEIRVKTMPIDPRSMFRGNYARLNYEFGRISKKMLPKNPLLHQGVIIYVELKQHQDGLYYIAGASPKPPENALYIRGRITNSTSPYRIHYGIEAFFAPKESAMKLEQQLRQGGVAILMVTGSGHVALKNIVTKEETSSKPL